MKKNHPLGSLKKFFNTITAIDWIFICISFVTLITFALFFKRQVVFTTATFKVTDENILYQKTSPTNEFANSFMVGDTERNELGQVTSEIVGKEAYKLNPETTVVYLDIKFKATYNPRKRQYSVRGKTIIFGESVEFSFSKIKFKAIVVDFPGFRDPNSVKYTKTLVKAQLINESRYFSEVSGVRDFFASAIKINDTVKDSKGNVLVRILDVKIEPAKRVVMTNTGQPYIINDPSLKDVFLTLELATREIENQKYMLNYIPLYINSTIPINTDLVSLLPTITEILQ